MRTAKAVLFCLAVAAVLITSLYVHHRAGVTLPIPWNDESWSLYPARNIAEHGRLLAPELNETKVIFCYPIQDAFLGLTYPLHGGDLRTVRLMSWACGALAFALVALWMFSIPARWWGLALFSGFYLSAPSVVAGNIVRPEAAMLALFAGVLVLSERRRLWGALSLAAVAAALHPAGVIGLGLFGVAALWVLVRERTWPTRAEGVAVLAASAVWIYYAQLILRHWPDYMEYLNATYSEPMTQSAGSVVTSAWTLAAVVPAMALVVWSLLARRALFLPAVVVLGLVLIPAIRTQMWYEVYKAWGLGLLGVMGSALLAQGVGRLLGAWPQWIRATIPSAVAAMACVPLLLFSYRHGWLEGPRNYPNDLTWGWGMRVEGEVPYFRPEDQAVLHQQLQARYGDASKRLMILPDADALLLTGPLAETSFYQPVRTSVSPDLVLVHDSRYKPDWVRDHHHRMAERSYQHVGILHERDGTERWTLWERRPLQR